MQRHVGKDFHSLQWWGILSILKNISQVCDIRQTELQLSQSKTVTTLSRFRKKIESEWQGPSDGEAISKSSPYCRRVIFLVSVQSHYFAYCCFQILGLPIRNNQSKLIKCVAINFVETLMVERSLSSFIPAWEFHVVMSLSFKSGQSCLFPCTHAQPVVKITAVSRAICNFLLSVI